MNYHKIPFDTIVFECLLISTDFNFTLAVLLFSKALFILYNYVELIYFDIIMLEKT